MIFNNDEVDPSYELQRQKRREDIVKINTGNGVFAEEGRDLKMLTHFISFNTPRGESTFYLMILFVNFVF